MDQSPKAKEIILKYDQETRNNKWYRKIADRLQRLICCVSSESDNPQEIHCGDGDISEPPCLVDITIVIPENHPAKISQLQVDQPQFTSSRPRRRKKRCHPFYQSPYTGGFESFVGD